MKREGWQHGTVRISGNKQLRVGSAADDAEAPEAVSTVLMGKAPVKPTNASKSTGKCRRPRCSCCHHHPVTKARDKAKGAHKLRACDVAINHRLVSWRVVVDRGGVGIPDYKGTSASSLLAYLAGSGNSWHEDDDETGSLETALPPADGGLSDLYDIIVGRRADNAVPRAQEPDPVRATDILVGDSDALKEQEQDVDDVKEADEDELLGFCMVGITIAVEFSDGEEDWIVVDEI